MMTGLLFELKMEPIHQHFLMCSCPLHSFGDSDVINNKMRRAVRLKQQQQQQNTDTKRRMSGELFNF
jgi:hypothetical protein